MLHGFRVQSEGEGDGGDDGDFREELVEGAVELVGFGDDDIVPAHEEVRPVIAGDAAQEGRAALAALREDMGGEGGGGRLAVGAGDGEAALSPGDFTQGAGPLDEPVALLPDEIQFAEFMDGRRPDDEGFLHVGGNQVWPVLVMDGDPFPLQGGRQVRRGLVIPGHPEPPELEIPGQGAHPDAPDAYEIYVLHT